MLECLRPWVVGSLSWIIPSFILAIGLGFSWWQLRVAAREQQTSLLVHLSDRYDSESLVKGRQTIWKIVVQNKEDLSQKIDEFSKNDVQKYIQVTTVGNFFEDIGFLTKKHYLRLSSIKVLYREPLIDYYNHFREYIEQHKEEKTYEYFDWLVKKINNS